MDTSKKITGIIFAVLFIFTAVPALILSNFDRKAFSAEMYQQAFVREDFYNKLPAVLAEAITTTNSGQSRFPTVLQDMSREAWEKFLRTLLPRDTAQRMGDDILNSTFAYLNMQTDSVQLSLVPLKESLSSETGVQAAFTLLDALPDCTLQQMGQITLSLLTNNEFQLCKPPEDLYPLLTPLVQGQMQATARVIPDQITIFKAPPENDPRIKLQNMRFMMRLSPLIPMVFLLLMTLCVVNSLESWLWWWGIPFFITGILAILLGLSGAPLFGSVLQGFLLNRIPDYLPTIFLDYASDLAAAMVRAFLNPILWQGLVIALIGVIMVAGSFLIRRNKTSG